MITRTTRKFWGIWIVVASVLIKSPRRRKWLILLPIIFAAGLLLPQRMIIPVKGADINDWNDQSFWAYPWGTSVTHKGIDIFKEKGTPVVSASDGLVIYTHQGGKGGKSVMILGPKWRFHYYAHLNDFETFIFKPVSAGSVIGTLGDTGNAKGKSPHLHYAIISAFPYYQLWDKKAVHGWKKMFYLDPDTYLRK